MTTSVSVGKHQFLHAEVGHVPLLQSLSWLRRGWDDLRYFGLASLAHGALISVLGAILLLLFSTHVYLMAAAVTGWLLVGPIMTTAVCELSRRREAGAPLGDAQPQEATSRDTGSVLRFGALLAGFTLLWFAASATTLQAILHTSAPSLSVALWGGLTDAVTRPQLLGYLASGAVLAAVVFTLSVVSVPLIIDRHASASEAMWTSARVVFSNFPAMLVWAALIVALTALGFVTFLFGMVIVAPLLGHATWHAYRDLVR